MKVKNWRRILEIPKQGIYGIVGRNGSGKTVLIKCLCGFMPVTEGEIWVGEKQVGRDVEFIEDTGFIIETPGFLPRESGFRNLRYLASIRNVVGKERIRSVSPWLVLILMIRNG